MVITPMYFRDKDVAVQTECSRHESEEGGQKTWGLSITQEGLELLDKVSHLSMSQADLC